MEKLFSERENIHDLIEAEWAKYKQAIRDDKPFEEIKIIYLRIKELKGKIMDITDEIHSKLKIGD